MRSTLHTAIALAIAATLAILVAGSGRNAAAQVGSGSGSGCIPRTCTPDDCGTVPNGCGGTMSCPGMCQCPDDTPPPQQQTKTWNVDPTFSIGCPVINGNMGVMLDVDITSTTTKNDCPVCLESGSSDVYVRANVLACNNGVTAVFRGGGTHELRACRKCDSACGDMYCDWGDHCETKSAQYGGGIGFFKLFGFKQGFSVGPASAKLACAARVKGDIGVMGSGSETKGTNGSCDCQSCKTEGASVHVGAHVPIDCMVVAGWGGATRSFGCNGCGQLDFFGNAGVSKSTGECPNQTCINGSIRAEASAFAGGCLGIGWFGVTVQARCRVSGECKKSTCANPADGCTAAWDCGMQVTRGCYVNGGF